jgi:hypothetical protein
MRCFDEDGGIIFQVMYKVTNDFRWNGKAESGSSNLKQIEKNKNMVYFDINVRKKVHRRNGKT